MAIPFLNVGTAIALWLLSTTYLSLHFQPLTPPALSPLTLSLLIFNNLNIFIALCEICLGVHILLIKQDYKRLREKYAGNEWGACINFLTMPLTLSQLFDGKTWSKMWSTYALYDPSYQNHESFGFFIDFGNGLSTIPPSIMMNMAMVAPQKLSPLLVGTVGLAMYWQVMYGTIIYVLSYVFNKRYEGKSLVEVCLFVGVSNSLWFFFPIWGIYCCVGILRDGNMEVFQSS
ncbi:predicted protein [Thalassiosira pseudonana CCMP1335]|uniref:EXPERA domain-containing protein n=1 Tax=Thalassiosira pseudonana TaxID=35128 RepID=B8CDE7_THAPS|nr:predicted protein [Thalassiosira pseudonana CCMP1335]EED88586.1 predicted protein [Thalassiosira pseudonana CCMP1335]